MAVDPSTMPAQAPARLAESGRLADVVAPDSPARAELADAARRYARPLQIHVSGRVGSGRATCVRALGERLSVAASSDRDDRDADLWLHVLTGPPRGADTDMLARLPADRTIVVLNKADTHRDRFVAAEVAGRCAEQIDRTVIPVSALLACTAVTDVELGFLRGLARAGEMMPAMAGAFLTAGPDDERSLRGAVLRRIDRAGIEVALDLLAADPDDTVDAAMLDRELWQRSGIDDVIAPIRERVGVVRRWRLAELRTRLEIIAARGHDRDAVEPLLRQLAESEAA
ncbi:MAG: hypothetical protein SW127_03705 [Actinomycetota bacterium]|nr:hypothetical protein [Actinomycetota bacterium]